MKVVFPLSLLAALVMACVTPGPPGANTLGPLAPAKGLTSSYYKVRPPVQFRRWAPPSCDLAFPVGGPVELMSDYGARRGRRGRILHLAVDLMPVAQGQEAFVPILAVADGRVVHLIDEEKFTERGGRFLKGEGIITKNRRTYPRTIEVEGYGVVHPFSRNYGPGRSGLWVVIAHSGGRLEGVWSHYMHLGATCVRKGDFVRAGQEIGLMGGTAILHDRPHLHFALSKPKLRGRGRGHFMDPQPLLDEANSIYHAMETPIAVSRLKAKSKRGRRLAKRRAKPRRHRKVPTRGKIRSAQGKGNRKGAQSRL